MESMKLSPANDQLVEDGVTSRYRCEYFIHMNAQKHIGRVMMWGNHRPAVKCGGADLRRYGCSNGYNGGCQSTRTLYQLVPSQLVPKSTTSPSQLKYSRTAVPTGNVFKSNNLNSLSQLTSHLLNWPSFGKGENKSQLIDIVSQPHQTMVQYTDMTL